MESFSEGSSLLRVPSCCVQSRESSSANAEEDNNSFHRCDLLKRGARNLFRSLQFRDTGLNLAIQ